MATIRASCDTCGDVEFPTSDVRVHAPEDGGAASLVQVPGPAIAAAAKSAGLEYLAIPVSHAGFSEEQVDAMAGANRVIPLNSSPPLRLNLLQQRLVI